MVKETKTESVVVKSSINRFDGTEVSRIVTRKIPGVPENELIKGIKKHHIPVRNGFPPLHTLMVCVGACNSGKTNFAIAFTKDLLEDKSINRVILMSPTYENNDAFSILNMRKDDIFSGRHVLDNGIQCVLEIEQKIKAAGEDYEEYLVYCKAYKAYLSGTSNYIQDSLVENNLYQPPKFMARPQILLFLDDLSNTTVFSTSRKNPFINMVLRHRHIFGIGLSIIMAVQNFNTGIPKILRQNIRQFCIWGTHDSTQLESIYEQVAQGCDKETFLKVFKEATKEKHNFLTIDLAAKDYSIFRKNFDKEIIVSGVDDEDDTI